MKLYLLTGCPFAHRASIALREKNLAFDPVFFEAKNRPAELDALGPHAKSPTIIDDGVGVWDSQIVLEYLDDRYPSPALLGDDGQSRAEARMLAARADRGLGAKQGILVMELLLQPKEQRDQAKVDAAKRDALAMLGEWDERLATRPFLLGEQLGFADVTLYTIIAALERNAGVTIPAELPRLTRWYERIAARPSAPVL